MYISNIRKARLVILLSSLLWLRSFRSLLVLWTFLLEIWQYNVGEVIYAWGSLSRYLVDLFLFKLMLSSSTNLRRFSMLFPEDELECFSLKTNCLLLIVFFIWSILIRFLFKAKENSHIYMLNGGAQNANIFF